MKQDHPRLMPMMRFGPDLEFLGPGSSVLGGSDVIATEVEQVIDLKRVCVAGTDCGLGGRVRAALVQGVVLSEN